MTSHHAPHPDREPELIGRCSLVVPGPTSACVALVGHRTTRKGHEDAAIPTQLDTDSLPEHRTRRMPDRRPLRGSLLFGMLLQNARGRRTPLRGRLRRQEGCQGGEGRHRPPTPRPVDRARAEGVVRSRDDQPHEVPGRRRIVGPHRILQSIVGAGVEMSAEAAAIRVNRCGIRQPRCRGGCSDPARCPAAAGASGGARSAARVARRPARWMQRSARPAVSPPGHAPVLTAGQARGRRPLRRRGR